MLPVYHYQQKVCARNFLCSSSFSNKISDQDDELLLDVPSEMPIEAGAVQPVEGDTEMTVDEEGRPRFAPAKQHVRPST